MIPQRLRLPVLAVAALLLSATAAFAQPSDNSGAAGACVTGGCGCLMALLLIAAIGASVAGAWKVFEKAGKPGWAAIVPIYNIIVLLEIIEKPIWWIVLFLVCWPVGGVMAGIELAKKFGKDTMYGVGLGLLPFVFYPILGFGKDPYLGAAAPPPEEAM